MKFRYIYIFLALISSALTLPLEPGQPGGPWTSEEIEIVRDKVIRMMDCQANSAWGWGKSCWFGVDGLPDKFDGEMDEYSHDEVGVDIGPRENNTNQWRSTPNPTNFWKRGPKASLLIQLAFHDCLRYEDGTGGCDGCLNWKGVGYRSPKALAGIRKKHPEWVDAWPKATKTTNNKLQLSARSLELIYTLTDWPPGARSLDSSLRESGKSRADLWQFAGNIALEKAINTTSASCRKEYDGGENNPERQIKAIEGKDKCEMRLERPIPFRSGRVDCIPDESLKWTPYAFEATKTEKHSNPHGSANQIIDNLRDDFNFTVRDTISLMALHGLSGGINAEQSTKYEWIGGQQFKTTFSNVYHKFLNGKTFWRGPSDTFGIDAGQDPRRSYPDYFIGDKDGNPVGGTAWSIRCRSQWNDTESGEEKRTFGGPCDFRPSHPGCAYPTDSDLQMRQQCFIKRSDGSGYRRKSLEGCESAELFEKDGYLYQKGGPPMNQDDSCLTNVFMFAFPYEVGFVLNFTDINNYPRGCGPLDGDWRMTGGKPNCNSEVCQGDPKSNRMYIGSPGYDGSPPCGANTYAPEGEASADIVAKFADDHEEWQRAFFDAWEKMQLNGYNKADMTESPENARLLPFQMMND